MATLKELETRDKSNWCPGCGNFGIQAAIKQAIVNIGVEPHDVMISTGIGCGSKMNQWIETYGFAGLHGRSLPVAMGAKLSNHSLTVLDVGGDGDGYGIGIGHFIHNMRRNFDMTYIVEDNQVYGLTLGQTSPTSDKGAKGPSTPFGIIEAPINPIRLALSSDCTFVARGFSGDIPHLTSLIEAGINHKGFALIDVFQPCVTFNKVNTYAYFRNKVYKLEEAGHDSSDLGKAFEKAGETEKLPIGIFYKTIKPTYEDNDLGLKDGVPRAHVDISNIDIAQVEESFM